MNPDPLTLDAETLAALNDKAKAAKLLNKLIAMLRRDGLAGERAAALHQLDRFFASGGNPHSFRVEPGDKMSGWDRSDHYEAASKRQVGEINDLIAKLAELTRKLAEAQQQRSHADPDKAVPLTSLLSPDVIPELEADEIQRRIRSLEARRFIRINNITTEIDLPMGELMHALDVAYVREFGRRKKRGSKSAEQSRVPPAVRRQGCELVPKVPEGIPARDQRVLGRCRVGRQGRHRRHQRGGEGPSDCRQTTARVAQEEVG